MFIAVLAIFHQSSGAVVQPRPNYPLEYTCGGIKFETINASIFDKPANIYHLDMSDCGVQNIEPNALVALTNLQILNLNYNDLTEIKKNDFAGPSNLTKLYLTGNQIKTFDYGVLNKRTLHILSLAGNPLNEVDLRAFNPAAVSTGLNLSNTTSNIIFPGESEIHAEMDFLLLDGIRNKQPDGNVVFKRLRKFYGLTSLSVEIEAFVGGIKFKTVYSIFPKLRELRINNCKVNNLGELFKFDRCVKHLIN